MSSKHKSQSSARDPWQNLFFIYIFKQHENTLSVFKLNILLKQDHLEQSWIAKQFLI